MANERLFLCGETKIPKRNTYPKKIKKVKLLLSGKEQNITLKIKDITRKMVAELPPIYEDLIEIATYVYCADQAVPRGGSGARSVGANWRRNMYFLIAVRNPRFWNRKKVRETLIELLDFLSDDNYEFRFTKLTKPP